MENPLQKRFAAAEIAKAAAFMDGNPEAPTDPRIERLVNELIGRIADKWTLLVLELLEEKGTLRFTRIAEQVEGISQKMLTQTLRQMERDGLVTRTVHPVVPPRVDYALTPLGNSQRRFLRRVGLGRAQSGGRGRGPVPLRQARLTSDRFRPFAKRSIAGE